MLQQGMLVVPLTYPCLLPAELDGGQLAGQGVSIHSMSTDEWQEAYEADGYVDLWVEEEFNSGSRLEVWPCRQHYRHPYRNNRPSVQAPVLSSGPLLQHH